MFAAASVVKSNLKSVIVNIFKYAVLVFFGITTVYPMLWVFLNSFKDNNDIFSHPFSLPSVWRFENYVQAWDKAHLNIYLVNSIIISTGTIILTLVVCSMAAYILARIRFKMNFAIYSYFLFGMMMPTIAALIPLFIVYKNMGMLNSFVSMTTIYTSFGIAICIFILTGFMKTIPVELEESAVIDGCSPLQVFLNIILPISKAALVTAAIIGYLDAWNEYLFALVFLTKMDMKTLTLGLASFKTQHFTFYGLMSAGIFISIIPVIIIYAFLQEKVIKGLTTGALKG